LRIEVTELQWSGALPKDR